MDIEYLPSAYLFCCESGHNIQLFATGEQDGEFICAQCGLTLKQIQELTIGDGLPHVIIGGEQ